jgi:hypothetical protein
MLRLRNIFVLPLGWPADSSGRSIPCAAAGYSKRDRSGSAAGCDNCPATVVRGYQNLAAPHLHFHRIFGEPARFQRFVSLMISAVYLLFELCLSQIKHAT